MNDMGTYVVQIICFQAVFLALYYALLRQETFFQYNRFYLLASAILSLVLPLVELSSLQATMPVSNLQTLLPEIVLGTPETAATSQQVTSNTSGSWFTVDWILMYIVGVIASSVILIIKLKRLHTYLRFRRGNSQVIAIPNSSEAFTFFNLIFIGEDLDPLSRKQILNHEYIHCKQRHTWDLLLFEVLKIALWFNPLIYVYQKQVSLVHEYLADQNAVRLTSKKTYYQELLNATFGTRSLSFTNTFFNQSLIKKRIVMLQKSSSKRSALLKYTLISPVIFAMLVQVAWSQETGKNESIDSSNFVLMETDDLYFIMIKDSTELKPNEISLLKTLKFDNSIDVRDITNTYKSNSYVESKGVRKTLMLEKRPKIESLIEENSFQVENLKEILESRRKANTDTYPIETVYEEENLDIPFAVIDKVPTYPECEQLDSNEEKKKCMSDNVSKYVNKNFNLNLASDLKLYGVNRVFVSFRINKKGYVDNVKARAPHPQLEEEARRVIYNLPKMIPGEQDGETVGVLYSLPITFKVAQ